jgi:UDP-3-O-[3-hydroxymyristoyl] glucosamine N-acyltransferase
MKLGEIAKRLACQLEGEPGIEIHGVAGITQAVAGQLTFVSNPRYRQSTRNTRASAVILAGDAVIERDPGLPPLAALRSANPYLDFARAMEIFFQPPQYAPGIHPTAVIAPSAKIGDRAHVGPYCFVDEGVTIGKDAVLHSFVTVYRNAKIGDSFFAHAHAVVREGCRIGNRVLLQNGVIVGGDGFGFAKQADGRWHKMLQTGITVLGDDVEIQANSCVDRATIGHTQIHRGAKLDDLVLVGHGATVGEDTLLCGQVGLAGTTEIGNGCILGGQVGCSGHFKVGNGAMLTPQSGVPSDIPAGEVYSGSPAVEHRQWMKNSAALNLLPELIKTVRKLQKEMESVSRAGSPQI